MEPAETACWAVATFDLENIEENSATLLMTTFPDCYFFYFMRTTM
jgi:hypothetical protein